MKHKNVIITLVIILLTFSGLAHHSTDMGVSVSEYEIEQDSQLAQEFNVSSYMEYARAAGDIILGKLYNESDGSIWKNGNHDWEFYTLDTSLSDYYWAIAGLKRLYDVSVSEGTPNETISIAISRAAQRMVYLFIDEEYSGFGVNTFSPYEVRSTKRAGVQAYAYDALKIAEEVNASIDFTSEKESAIRCITDMLYDETNGGLHFFTMRNGSLSVPDYIYEVYPNDGKRLDHLALGIIALFDAWDETGNSSLLSMANRSVTFMLDHMKQSFQHDYYGLGLAVNRTGGSIEVDEGERPGDVVVSDINAIAIRALMKAYEVTSDEYYLEEAESVFDALLENNWDTVKGGWFAETLFGEPFDPLDDEDVKYYKYAEIQFQLVFALAELYQETGDLFKIRIIIDVLDLVLSRLWDIEDGGFVQNGNQEWLPLSETWQVHHTAVQGQSILALERLWSYGLPIISLVRINPVSPRPIDEVLVSTLAQDSDGIDSVYINYTKTFNDVTKTGIIPLHPNPEAGGIYNNTFGVLNDTTRVNFYVYANDSLGNTFIAGSYYFIIQADTYAPSVSLRRVYPSEVKMGDEVIIEVGTNEFPAHSLTESCKLFWKVNDGYYQDSNMTLAGFEGSEFVWQINLGSFNAGDKISYYCMATDESGNTGTSSFYRLTILGSEVYVSPLAAWQIIATIALISAPGFGFAYAWSKRKHARERQRELKKQARKRGKRTRGKGRSRSRRR